MTTVGADVEALRQLAQMFTDNSSKLTGDVIPTINSRLNSSGWVGEDAESFKADWHGHLMGQLNNAATQLSDAAATLNRNADEQEQASSIAGASSALQSGLSNPQPANNDPAEDKAKSWWEKAKDWWNKPIEDKLHDISDWTGKAAAVCTIVAGVLAVTGVGAPVAAALFTTAQVLTIASASTDIASNSIKLYNGDIGWREFAVETGFDALSIAGAGGSLAGLSKASNITLRSSAGEIKQAFKSPTESTMKYVGKEAVKEILPSPKDQLYNTAKEAGHSGLKYAAQVVDSRYQGKPMPVFDPYESIIKPLDKGRRGPWAEVSPMPNLFKKAK
jgi:hypothetical protein